MLAQIFFPNISYSVNQLFDQFKPTEHTKGEPSISNFRKKSSKALFQQVGP